MQKLVLIKMPFQDASQCDPVLHELMCIIINGWENAIDVSKLLCRYWENHETPIVKDEIIQRSKALVVPSSKCWLILEFNHAGHQEFTYCQLHVCSSMFPQINSFESLVALWKILNWHWCCGSCHFWHRASYSHIWAALVDTITSLQGSDRGVVAALEVHETLGFLTFWTVLRIDSMIIWSAF